MLSISTDIPELQKELHQVLIQIVAKNPVLLEGFLKDFYEKNREELKIKIISSVDENKINDQVKQALSEIIENKYDTSIQEKVDSSIDDDVIDNVIDNAIDHKLEDFDFDSKVDGAIDDAINDEHIDRKVEEEIERSIDTALNDIDVEKKADEYIESDIESQIGSVEEKIIKITNEYIDGISSSLNDRIDTKVSELVNIDLIKEILSNKIMSKIDSLGPNFIDVLKNLLKEIISKDPSLLQDIKNIEGSETNMINIIIPREKYKLVIDLLTALNIKIKTEEQK